MVGKFDYDRLVFASIEAKRFSSPGQFPKKIGINHNPNVSNFKKISDTKVLLNFQYNITYAAVGYIRMEGDILFEGPAAELEEVNREEGKLPPEFMEVVLQTIMAEAGFEAAIMAKKLQMPSPLPMNVPKVNLQKKDDGKKKAKVQGVTKPYDFEVA